LRSSTKQGRSYGFSATWTSIVRSVGSATLASTTASVVMLSLITYGMTEQVFPVTLMEVIIKSLQSIQQQLKVSYGTQHMPLALLSTVVPVILQHFANTTVCAGSLRIAQDSGTAGHQHFYDCQGTANINSFRR
jgi:hypothetical protein